MLTTIAVRPRDRGGMILHHTGSNVITTHELYIDYTLAMLSPNAIQLGKVYGASAGELCAPYRSKYDHYT